MIYDWHIVNTEIIARLAENKPAELIVEDRAVVILLSAGKIFAFAATCPHAGAPLCTGWIDAKGHIVCPMHKYRFNPANGYNSSGEGYKLKTYPVEKREQDIYIGLW